MERGRRRSGRQQQAFEDLLDPAFLDEDLLGSSGGGRKAAAAAGRRREQERSGSSGGKLRGFQLRSEMGTQSEADGAAQDGAAVRRLAAMFGSGGADEALIAEVHSSTGGSIEATAAALRQMGFGESGSGAGPSQLPASSSSSAAGTQEPPAASSGPDWWQALPEDLKLAVWQRLGPADIARAAGVSREFESRARQSRARRTEVAVPPGLTMQALTGLVCAYPAAQRLGFRRCLPEIRHAVHWLDRFEAIAAGSRRRVSRGGLPVTGLDLRNAASLADADVAALLATLGSLQELRLAGCERLGPATAQALAHYRAWDLAPSPPEAAADGVAAQQPQAEGAEQQQQQQQQQQLQRGGTARHLMQRAWAEREARAAARERAAAVAAPLGPGLARLDLSGCRGLNAASLKALLTAGCTAESLAELAVSGLAAVEDSLLESLSACRLRCLRAQHCASLQRVSISLPADHPLQELHLTGCSLESVGVAAPGLRLLGLGQCRRLEQVSLKAPQLRALQLALCPRLAAVEAAGGLPELEQLNANGCASLLSAPLAALLAAAPGVRRLDLNGCVGLGELSLADQAALQSLDATGCRALRRLACAAPGLRTLLAVGCTRLTEVSLLSKSLQALDLQNCGQLAAVLLGGEASGGRLRYRVVGCPRLDAASLAGLRAAGRPARRVLRD